MLPLDGLPWARFDVLAASFTLNLLALVMPIVILQTYDRIVPNNSRETLVLLVLVSHRPSLLQLADELYEIKDGLLVRRTARPQAQARAAPRARATTLENSA